MECRRRGKNPNQMDTAEMREVVMKVTTVPEKMKALGPLAVAHAKNLVGMTLSLEQLNVREKKCEVCPHLKTLSDSFQICLKCGCHGTNWIVKRKDPAQKCPIDQW